MPIYFVPLLTFVAGMLIAMIASHRVTTRAARVQQEIAHRGELAQGVVTRIWQPPLAGSFPRIYFEYQPGDSQRVVRCCHIDRRSSLEPLASLPPAGARVAVRYLPENPSQAVIAKLISRFVH